MPEFYKQIKQLFVIDHGLIFGQMNVKFMLACCCVHFYTLNKP